MYTYIVMTSVF